MTDVTVSCKICGQSFSVPASILESRVMDTCMTCFRSQRIDLQTDELLNRPNHVIDGLYIGNFQSATKLGVLVDKYKISHIIVCGKALKCHFPDDFKYLMISIDDSHDQDIHQYFESTNAFIKLGTENNGKVLVHCHAGVSRSATLVLAYLMYEYHMTLDDAKALLKSKRPCTCPNRGFLLQLEAYEAQLKQV